MMEIWKKIKEYPNYEVSDHGSIRSLGFKFHKAKVLKPGLVGKENGQYLSIQFGKNGKKRYVHRLVAVTFIKNPVNKREVNHKDGNKLNNHVSNLEWVTPSENRQHAYDTGLKVFKGNRYTKLTNLIKS